jgi:molecular chaperone GrpE
MAEEKKNKEKIKASKLDPTEIIKGLKELLERSENEKKEYLSGWQREKADAINYKAKEAERMGEIVSFSKLDIFLRILPIIDNLNLAEKAIPQDKKADNNIKGLLMIKRQLEEVLEELGLQELDRLNKKFDPSVDEVIEVVEAGDEVAPETVIEEISKGYSFNGKLIRPAKVKISK